MRRRRRTLITLIVMDKPLSSAPRRGLRPSKERKPKMSCIKIAVVAAIAENNVIGFENALPWRIPVDLRRFRELTIGKPTIMGRRTYESLKTPMKDRRLIVISRDPCYEIPHGDVASTIEKAITIAKTIGKATNCHEIMIAGGAAIYRKTIELSDRLYITKIKKLYAGDSYFPDIDDNVWSVSEESTLTTPEGIELQFLTYRRGRSPI